MMQVLILLCVVAAAFAGQEKTCLEEADGGMCRGYFPMYYYDPKTQTCQEFIYGGCQGNGNRYATLEECEKNCDGVVVWDSVESDCNLAPESGVCDAYFKKYYFDRKSGLCQQFVYGGCGGNENNFNTKYECEKKCKRTADRAICELEKVVGPCRAAFRKFFFNKETGKCEKFIYGGCLGNGNNFDNQDDCEAVCVA